MMASARGYLNQSHTFNTQGLTDSKTFNFDFRLTPAFRPVQLENIFYEFGRWDLRPDSEAGLQALLKLLNDNPNITIELSAHTDFVGSAAANKLLSERRAESVVNYLVANGIARDRLTAVGHGAERPFTVDANTAQKYDFLNEGDVLTESFIRALTPEQQEIANQINRRTEFRVLRTNYNLQ
jgi:peptidoglycan-associated lipoprotein